MEVAVARRSARKGVGRTGEAPAPPQPAQPPPADPSNIHVLVVGSLGEEEGTKEPIVSILRASYTVTVAASDAEALALLRAADKPPVDLVVKEHAPPASDALKFIARLAKLADARHIPVVVVSSLSDRQVVSSALHSGAADYLVKPLRRNELGTIWAHVWRRLVNTAGAAPAAAAGAQPSTQAARRGARAAERAAGGEGSDGEGSGQGSADAPARNREAEAAEPPAAAEPAATARPAMPAHTALRAAPGAAFFVPVAAGQQAGAPAAFGAARQSAFVAYGLPTLAASAAPADLQQRPWPHDPAMAAAAAAASLAMATSFGLHAAGAHVSDGAPFVPIGPPPYSLFPQLPAAAAAAAAQAPQAGRRAQSSPPQPPQPPAPAAAARLRSTPRDGLSIGSRHVGRPGAGAGGGSSDGTMELQGSAFGSMDPEARARRAAALQKFRDKRSKRCFTKKIHYTSRKQLAEARPRVRGQFVRIPPGGTAEDMEDGAALLALAGSG